MKYAHYKIFKYSLMVISLVGLFVLSTATVHAANLEVDFEADPLFSEVNFLPGNEVTRTVEVTNNSESEQDIIMEAINAVDDDGLGDALELVITEGETTLYDDMLSDFLRAGEVSLSSLSSGDSKTYTFGVTFDDTTGNDVMGAGLSFDLCVGFEGGDTNCGDTVIGNEGESGGDFNEDGGGTITGSGGGPVAPNAPFEITGESVAEVDLDAGTATITWTTNYLSTSQVIYGPEADGPFSLNLTTLPYFGYPSGTVEDPTKIISHSVELTGLTPGETYKFRAVSRSSPPTVGFEYIFEFIEETEGAAPPPPILAHHDTGGTEEVSVPLFPKAEEPPVNEANTGVIPTTEEVPDENSGGGEQADDDQEIIVRSIEDDSLDKEGVSNDETTNDTTAAAIFAFPGGLSGWVMWIGLFLLILLTIYIFLISRRRKREEL